MGEPCGAAGGLPGALSDAEARVRAERIDELLGRLEKMPGPTTDLAMEAIEALTEIYGTALARICAMAAAGTATPRLMAADEVVGHLLLLHGLHPDPPEQRVARALDQVRPHVGDGGQAELDGIRDGVATIRLTAAGCQSTVAALAASVRDVVLAAAPELTGVETTLAKPPTLIPVDTLLRRPAWSSGAP